MNQTRTPAQKKSIAQHASVNPTALAITRIKGVGAVMASKLQTLGIVSALDLLFHLPLRHEDRTRVSTIRSLQNGLAGVVKGIVVSNNIQYGKRRSLVCRIQDDSGTLSLRFFHFSAAQQKNLAVGETVRCFGEVSLAREGLCMIHPEYEIEKDADIVSGVNTKAENNDCLTAIYPSAQGIHQARWRNFITSAFTIIKPEHLRDLLSPQALADANINQSLSLYDALKTLHFPHRNINLQALRTGMHPTQRRLAFEELVAQRLSHMIIKNEQKKEAAIAISPDQAKEKIFREQLPFMLTNAQNKVLDEIIQDIQKPHAMLRLIQGDVGSGKTVVAAIAAMHAVSNGLQVAIMAPTEILAEQHRAAIHNWLSRLNISVGLLVSKMPSAEKQSVLDAIIHGDISVIIGTHALIQKTVQFFNLGLIVIDEQHRFGVEQRRELKNKRNDDLSIHQLVMTATPIPRTLAMTFYADLDYSVIDELPPGRTPVQTVAISNERRDQVIDRVRQACLEGRQVFWVCTLVEESEVLQCQAAESTATELAEQLEGISVGLVHGRVKAEQKSQVMNAFKQGDIQLLVATTVIEVGVDVPNASLMIIENPERLGLAQLHQLRGRVGRGSIESHCVLLYQKPLSKNGKQRLDIMRQSNDGFVLAEQDLKIRGPGEVLGTRQSGAMTMRLADLERDADMIDAVVKISDQLHKHQPTIAKQLIQRWRPLAERYNNV